MDAKTTRAARQTLAPVRDDTRAAADAIVEETVERATAEAKEEALVEQHKQRELEPQVDEDDWMERMDEETLLQQADEMTARREQLEREVENFFEQKKTELAN